MTAARWAFLAAHVLSIGWAWALVVIGEHRPRPTWSRQSMKGF